MTQDNRVHVYHSVCRICHGGCLARLYVRNGRLIRVKPEKGSPFNLGQMCVKGLSTPEMMYHPSRLTTPLKRIGNRGAGKWEQIEWEQAMEEIAYHIRDLSQAFGPECIAIGQGTGRHHFMHVIRFANALGTPNWYEPGLANCLVPRITACQITHGGFVTADYYGKILPKIIIFWGHNPLISGPDGELSFPAKRALNAGAFGIAIDPRRSETAKRCGMWLPVRPGTDAALALAMIHVVIHENLFDTDFVEKWTTGFNELKHHVVSCSPEWASGLTGIPEPDIVRTARLYATHKPGVIEWGVALEHTPNAFQTVRAIAILRGLTGNIDIPGSDILGMNILRPYPVLRNALSPEQSRKRIGASEFKLLGGYRAVLPSAHIPGIFSAILTGKPYPVKAVLNFGSNPLLTIPNPRTIHQALMALDLFVVADFFMTPTAALADYILPAAMWPEVNQTIELPFVSDNAVLAQQRVVTVEKCRQDEEVLIDLSRRLSLPGSGDSLEDILDYRLSSLDVTFQQLKDLTMIYPPHEYRKFEKQGFRTPSRKFEFYSHALKRMGYDPMPCYQEPPESPLSQPALATRFPLVLTTGSRRKEFFHSEHRQIRSLRSRRPRPLAEIHPNTANVRGIKDGDSVVISSPRGRIRMTASLITDIREDMVNIEHGWWFPEKGPPEFGVWDANANLLTSGAPPYDTALGTYQLRALLCEIEKADSTPDINSGAMNSNSNYTITDDSVLNSTKKTASFISGEQCE
jgi:thiosulfate reductase/polysulfide reductase chain A